MLCNCQQARAGAYIQGSYINSYLRLTSYFDNYSHYGYPGPSFVWGSSYTHLQMPDAVASTPPDSNHYFYKPHPPPTLLFDAKRHRRHRQRIGCPNRATHLSLSPRPRLLDLGARSPSYPRLSSASSSAPVSTTTLMLSHARNVSTIGQRLQRIRWIHDGKMFLGAIITRSEGATEVKTAVRRLLGVVGLLEPVVVVCWRRRHARVASGGSNPPRGNYFSSTRSPPTRPCNRARAMRVHNHPDDDQRLLDIYPQQAETDSMVSIADSEQKDQRRGKICYAVSMYSGVARAMVRAQSLRRAHMYPHSLPRSSPHPFHPRTTTNVLHHQHKPLDDDGGTNRFLNPISDGAGFSRERAASAVICWIVTGKDDIFCMRCSSL
ncbi:hypothetical protein BDZ89DRAFT_1048773 [Hymenopellis radicata]|nr:hypothetical protein BDZ89DRAFT_1048773 [Hymenopellis radicata]